MAKISVIIPCYNVEKYIDRCLESIVNQTIGADNIQIITVDDASTDGTLKRLSAWENRYPDVFLVVACEHNGKQGSARNIGMSYAEGEFIFFMDGDDFLELDALDEMYRRGEDSNADVVKIKYAVDYCNGTEFTVTPSQRSDVEVEYDAKAGNSFLCAGEMGRNGNLVGAAGSLYRRSFISDNGLSFPEGLFYEDNFWNSVSSMYIRKLYVIDMCYYHYRVNSESTVNKRNNLGLLDKLVVELMILEEYQKLGKFEMFCETLFFQFLQRACFNFLYQLFCKFDYLPIDINELKSALWTFFGRYRYSLSVDQYQGTDCEKLILNFLVSDEEYTLEMQEKLKKQYLASLMG